MLFVHTDQPTNERKIRKRKKKLKFKNKAASPRSVQLIGDGFKLHILSFLNIEQDYNIAAIRS